MGMFDNVFISLDLLPLSEEEKKLIGDGHFQTKSLDCLLEQIYITKDDILRIGREEKKEELVKHTGNINFYTYINNKKNIYSTWFEFDAIFLEGKLLYITRIKEEDDG